MSGLYYRLNADHTTEPLTRDAIAAARSWPSADERRVGRDEVGDYLVSTVFLVIDHGWRGIPLLFETMVFPGDDIGTDLFCDRYTTWDQAKAGHDRVVAALRNGTEPGDLECAS